MDRAAQGPVMVASPAGGMDIEQVAKDTPHLIFKVIYIYIDLSISTSIKMYGDEIGF